MVWLHEFRDNGVQVRELQSKAKEKRKRRFQVVIYSIKRRAPTHSLALFCLHERCREAPYQESRNEGAQHFHSLEPVGVPFFIEIKEERHRKAFKSSAIAGATAEIAGITDVAANTSLLFPMPIPILHRPYRVVAFCFAA